MARQVIVGSRPVALAAKVPGGSARGHSHRCHLRRPPSLSSTFLRSLRSMAVTPLPRYYRRSDSCPPNSWTRGIPRACSTCGQVSLIHALGLPAIPSPTICGRSASSGHVPHRRVEPRLHPHGSSPNRNSGLRPWLAGSPHPTDRIEFVILRTGRLPPVASHHASRRDLALQRDRSYVRLQVTSTWRGLTAYTSLTNCALRRTRGRPCACPNLGAHKGRPYMAAPPARSVTIAASAWMNSGLSFNDAERYTVTPLVFPYLRKKTSIS